jgi:radical SAM superfamily enzyme
VQKGVTAKEQIDAGRKVRQAGISLSEYIMPGLGGKSMWREHAIETARVLNEINPDFIRVRTLKALRVMPIFNRIETGELELMSDDEIVVEEKLLIENLDGITSQIVSDHILNLLEEVEGKFPEAKAPILAIIDRYLALPESERLNFRLGRRTGFYRSLDDLENPGIRAEVDQIMHRIEMKNPQNLDQVISELMESFI